MSQDGRARDTELLQRPMQKVGLRIRRPDRSTGTLAVAIAGTVKDDDTIFLGGDVDEAARLEILDHAAIAVKQHERIALSTLHVMEPHPIHVEESPGRAVPALGRLGKLAVHDGRDGQRPNRHRHPCRAVAGHGSSSRGGRCHCATHVHGFHLICARHVSRETCCTARYENR